LAEHRHCQERKITPVIMVGILSKTRHVFRSLFDILDMYQEQLSIIIMKCFIYIRSLLPILFGTYTYMYMTMITGIRILLVFLAIHRTCCTLPCTNDSLPTNIQMEIVHTIKQVMNVDCV